MPVISPDQNVMDVEAFVIDDDVKANWALRTIRAERADAQRLAADCDEEIKRLEGEMQRYREKRDSCIETAENSCSRLKAMLCAYYEVQLANGKVKKTKAGNGVYRLPDGVIRFKTATKQLKHNDDTALLEQLEALGAEPLIKTTRTPRWADVKRNCQIDEDGNVTLELVDNDTGEITLSAALPAVTVETVPSEYVIETAGDV